MGSDVRDEVISAARARASALVDADADGLRTVLHEQFRWTTHRGDTYDREEYIRRNTGGRLAWNSQQLTGTDVVVVGDTAVLRAEVTDTVQSGTFRMPMTQVWVRTGDGWQCLAGHAGPLRS